MSEPARSLRRPKLLAVRPALYRGEWLQSAISRWAWSIFGVSRGTLLDAFGLADLSEREIRQMGQRAEDDVLDNIGQSLGLSPQELHKMTMDGFALHGPEVSLTNSPSIATRYLWARGTGTRYCPECLRERPGVFLAAWRLTWAFACLRHGRILLDACPHCLLPVQEVTGRSRFTWDPNLCRANLGGGLPVTPCGADLTGAWDELPLAESSPVLPAQAHIYKVIRDGPASDRFFHALRGNASALRASGDFDTIARLSGLPREHLRGLIEPEQRVGSSPPSNAYAAAALITGALMLAVANDETARPFIRQLTFSRAPSPVPRGVGFGPGSPRELLARWGAPVDPMRRKILAAHDEDFTVSQRLVYGTAIASINDLTGAKVDQACGPFLHPESVPAQLWTEWAAPLDSGGAVTEWAFRSALSAAVLTVNRGIQLPEYIDAERTTEAASEARVSRLTRLLRPNMVGGLENADQLVRAITELAILLDVEPSPINYTQRTRMPWHRILPKEHWLDLCDAARHNPGGEVRRRNAQRYLFQRATLAVPGDLPTALAMKRHKQDAAEYSSFRAAITLELQEGLDAYLHGVLRASGIDEPVVWAPSRSLARVGAIGRELEDIDWKRLHELRAERCTESRMARELDRTVRHCVWAGSFRPHETAAPVEHVDWVGAWAAEVAG